MKTFAVVVVGRLLVFQISELLFHCFSQDCEVVRCALIQMSKALNKLRVIPMEQELQNAFSIFLNVFLNVFCLQHAFAQSWAKMINSYITGYFVL